MLTYCQEYVNSMSILIRVYYMLFSGRVREQLLYKKFLSGELLYYLYYINSFPKEFII